MFGIKSLINHYLIVEWQCTGLINVKYTYSEPRAMDDGVAYYS